MAVLLKAAAFLTRRQWLRWESLTAKPAEIQKRRLLHIVGRNHGTSFGREHHFDTIHSLSDYRQQVAINDYESLRHYVERAENGEANVLTRSEEHTSELQSLAYLVCRLLLEKKKKDK